MHALWSHSVAVERELADLLRGYYLTVGQQRGRLVVELNHRRHDQLVSRISVNAEEQISNEIDQ